MARPPTSPRISDCRSCSCSTWRDRRSRPQRSCAGFCSHDPAVRIAGVVLNRIASERHRALVADAIARLDVPILGALPREAALDLPERHLGLVQAGEHADLAALFDRLAEIAERYCDLEAIVAHAGVFNIVPSANRTFGVAAAGAADRARPRPSVQLRLSACDRCVAQGRRRDLPFSPLADDAPPPDADSCCCRAAIRSCTRKRSPPRESSPPACEASPRPGRCMASAAATWCWAKAWKTPPAGVMR